MVVVISGISSGLGLELARRFLGRGDTVVGYSRSAEVPVAHPKLLHFATDVADRPAVFRSVEASGLGAVDLVLQNAGLPGEGRILAEVDPAEVRQLLDVHLFGALNLAQAWVPALRRGVGKRLVHVGSRLGSLSFNQEPENQALKISYSYRISKAAQHMLAVCLANELAPEGIRVDVVHPGSFVSRCGRKTATATAAETAGKLVQWLDGPRPPGPPVLAEPYGRSFSW